ncbi:unnamed protein product, partial [Closterium sp. NIES-53]
MRVTHVLRDASLPRREQLQKPQQLTLSLHPSSSFVFLSLQWFKDRFNWAVFNNEGKWYFNEGYRQGEENYTVTDAMTNWFRQRNINVRAHNLFWAVENFVQPWVK